VPTQGSQMIYAKGLFSLHHTRGLAATASEPGAIIS
jgi:hypothetical protein